MAESDPWAAFVGEAPSPTHDPWAEFGAAHPAAMPAAAPSVIADTLAATGSGFHNAPIAGMTALPSIYDLGLRGIESMIHWAAPDSIPDLAAQSARHFTERNPQGLRDLAEKTDDPKIKGMFLDEAKRLETDPQLNASLKHGLHRYQDVSEQLTDGGGVPEYQPQSTPGRYAKTIAEFAPMALTGNEGAAANVLKGAVAPGIGSELAGDRFKGTMLETPAKILGAIVGGVAGHGVQTGVNAAKVHGAARTAARAAEDQVTGGAPITPGAIARVAKDVRTDELTPELAQAKASALGPEAMMLDMGRQVQGRAEAVATQPGKGQNTILDKVEGRTGKIDFDPATGRYTSGGENSAQRFRNTLDETMGESPNVVHVTNKISEMVDKVSAPLYKKVMDDHPVVNVPADITARPSVAQAMKDAVSLAKDHGEKLTGPVESTTILKGPGYHIADDVTPQAQTSLRYWDYVKKAMDHRINGMMKSGGVQTLDSSEKADLGGMIAARNALRDHLDTVTEGAYKTARSVAATKPQLAEAAEIGRGAFSNKLLPEEFQEMHENMSIPQQSVLRINMRRELERVMASTSKDAQAARRVLDTDQNLQKIEGVLGPDVARAIENRVASEAKFQEATNKIAQSSRTGVRQQLVKDTEAPSAASPPQANITGFLYKAGLGGLQHLRETGMERTRSGIGSLMTTPGDKVPDLVRILRDYNEHAAQNVRPPIAPYAKTLAGVLGLNAVQNSSQQNALPPR